MSAACHVSGESEGAECVASAWLCRCDWSQAGLPWQRVRECMHLQAAARLLACWHVLCD